MVGDTLWFYFVLLLSFTAGVLEVGFDLVWVGLVGGFGLQCLWVDTD